jgi:hypothetical protein
MSKLLPFLIFAGALPLVAIGILLIARRSKTIPNLSFSLLLSGITGAIFTAVIVFLVSPMPIAPYELARSSWYPVLWACLLGLYVGFGIGVGISSIIVSPLLLIKELKKNRSGEKTDTNAHPNNRIK